MKQMADVQTVENTTRDGAENRASQLPVNLPDTADLRGSVAGHVENYVPNASERPGDWKTGEGRIGGLTPDEWGQVAEGLENLCRMIWRGSVHFPGKTDVQMMASAERCSEGARWLRENYAKRQDQAA